jgi:hypothetical protein
MGSEGHPSGLAGGYVGQNPEDRPGSHQCIGEGQEINSTWRAGRR